MLKPEEKALDLFNRALKQCVTLSVEMNKMEAKKLCYNNLMAIKESFYDIMMFDDVPPFKLTKTINYYNKVKEVIDKL